MRPMLDGETLVRWLDAMGWSVSPRGRRTFRCVRSTEEGALDVYLRWTDNWLVASIVPFLTTGGSPSFELSRWLLRQNRDMRQIKFAYDEDGDVVLSVELPTESLDPGELHTALEQLEREAVRQRATLRGARPSESTT
ncbi:MAG: YbjN domain-containing protein [Myxococcota bacterium]|nr:YbjN domain-containing protein [Myxococcota bacterium]MDW8360833.1 YbjN domain-containing protein [Myxococcales bacterium]